MEVKKMLLSLCSFRAGRNMQLGTSRIVGRVGGLQPHCIPMQCDNKKEEEEEKAVVIMGRINLLQTQALTRCAGRPMKCSFHYH